MKKIEPIRVLREAQEDASSGRYDEALRKYKWFHEEAVAHDPDVYGIRRSFALRYWKELGEVYPPARVELERIRDAKIEVLRRGSTDPEQFSDVCAIDEILGQIERTSSLFAEISERDSAFAQKCFSSARPALVKTHDYQLARVFIRSPRATLERLAGRLNRSLANHLSTELDALTALQKAEIDNYIEDTQHLIEILNGVCEADEAQHIRSSAEQFLSSAPVRKYVSEHLRSLM